MTAERKRCYGSGKSVAEIEKKSIKVSFAYGVAPFKQGSELGFVIDAADKAMYLHKKSAR